MNNLLPMKFVKRCQHTLKLGYGMRLMPTVNIIVAQDSDATALQRARRSTDFWVSCFEFLPPPIGKMDLTSLDIN